MNRIVAARPSASATFRPWMGERYREQVELAAAGRTSCCDGLWHIMGESHYGDPAEAGEQFTIQVVEELAIKGYPFFDTVLSVVLDREVNDDNRRSGWSEVAFSNFVQDVLPDGQRRPTADHWQKGRQIFFAQLAETKPKQLLVVGAQQWQNLPNEGFVPFRLPDQTSDASRDDAGLYAYEVDGSTHFTLATWIYHPSSYGRLDIAAARERVRQFTMASCNILSDLGRDEQGWFYDAAAD